MGWAHNIFHKKFYRFDWLSHLRRAIGHEHVKTTRTNQHDTHTLETSRSSRRTPLFFGSDGRFGGRADLLEVLGRYPDTQPYRHYSLMARTNTPLSITSAVGYHVHEAGQN